MAIKFSVQGLLIYVAIAAYLVAFLTGILRKKRVAEYIYQSGFVVAVIAFAYRWYSVRHVPLQNLFEIFLGMAMLVYLLSVFSRRVLRIGGEAADMLIGAVLLVPPGFVFDAAARKLPPALQCWLFGPHVAVYLLAYVIMAKATVQAFPGLIGKTNSQQSHLVPYEEGTYRLICFGFPLLTLGLIMGSWWGKLAWGDYWGWDPKELWSLASWLIYVAYFHWRYMFGKKHARVNSLLAVVGFVAIVITLLWVNLSRLFAGLHSYAR
ncbi:MAG TPA: cytochrome c biogenesis protein CcsA [Sedimentisphaerales bacterium]|nr:cytochrome c biogenesis protein CcsA [Sedimentisphaerales bacterium]